MVFGRDSRESEARRPIGYLPENHRFPTYMTGQSMLDFYGALSGMDTAARRKRIPELLGMVGLADWGDVRLGKYSKGMLQRVGLAQALMHAPDLLILDEPTDGVDPIGRREIRAILNTLEQQGVTIFLNSHLLGEVELFCRDVAIIHRGRVAHALEFRMALQLIERRSESRAGQIDPPHHAADEIVLGCELEQPVRLLDQGIGLHHDGAIETIAFQNRFELRRQKISAQRRIARRHPRILETLDVPEVLVRVDSHRFIIKGTNAAITAFVRTDVFRH